MQTKTEIKTPLPFASGKSMACFNSLQEIRGAEPLVFMSGSFRFFLQDNGIKI